MPSNNDTITALEARRDLIKPVRNGGNHFHKFTADMQAVKIRDVEVLRLKQEGMTIRAIAAHLGMSKSAAGDAYKRAMRDVVELPHQEMRNLEISRLQALLADLYQLAHAPILSAIFELNCPHCQQASSHEITAHNDLKLEDRLKVIDRFEKIARNCNELQGLYQLPAANEEDQRRDDERRAREEADKRQWAIDQFGEIRAELAQEFDRPVDDAEVWQYLDANAQGMAETLRERLGDVTTSAVVQ